MTEQMLFDLPAGEAEKAKGQARVSQSPVNQEWRRRADIAMRYLLLTRKEFTADDLVALVGLPQSRNAVGALFSGYARKGYIVGLGWSKGKRKVLHAAAQRVWTKA